MLSPQEMLQQDEGMRYRAYKDTKGNITVGIGFNLDNPGAKAIWLHADIPESFNSIYTQETYLSTNSVVKLLNTCIDSCRLDLEDVLHRDVTDYPDYVQLALINLMFNMGKPTFSQFNTFIKLIKDKNYDDAATDLSNTRWSIELVNRSSRICKLIKGDYSGYITPNSSTPTINY